jgi:hypothetical protein
MNDKALTVAQYQAVSEALLRDAYGLELGDTRICEDEYAQALIDAGIQPHEYLTQHAEDCGLLRLDDLWGGEGVSLREQQAVIDKMKREA